MLRALCIPMLLTLTACSAPTRPVTLRVTTPGGEPVANAHVYAVVIGRSDVPLPVTLGTLEEALTRESASAWTDAAGEVRLTLDDDAAHIIFLRPPPLGPYAPPPGEAGAWRFLLEPTADGLTPDPPDPPGTPTGARLVLSVR